MTLFDEFFSRCTYFDATVEVNNGYGCSHPGQTEVEDGQGKCFCHSCPLGACEECDEEDYTTAFGSET